MPEEKSHLIDHTPWVSLSMKPVDDRVKSRVMFASSLRIPRAKINPDLVVAIKCNQCGAAKAVENIDGLLLNQPLKTESAAAVICPACVVVCSVLD